jgi:hypothetical protein
MIDEPSRVAELINELVDELVDRIAQQVLSGLVDELNGRLATQTEQRRREPPAPARVTVLTVGEAAEQARWHPSTLYLALQEYVQTKGRKGLRAGSRPLSCVRDLERIQWLAPATFHTSSSGHGVRRLCHANPVGGVVG